MNIENLNEVPADFKLYKDKKKHNRLLLKPFGYMCKVMITFASTFRRRLITNEYTWKHSLS